MPNAFALGRSPKSATVCATTGIMELLSPAELEGVMAHELTHVANRDVLVMTLAGFFATIAAYIVQFGFFFGGGASATTTTTRASWCCCSSRWSVYVVSFLLMQALSRYREFAADRGAAIITGRPSALASALQKISSGMQRIPQKDLRAAGELQAFFIFPAAKGKVSRPVRHAPADGEADRGAAAARGAAPGPASPHSVVGFLDILRGKRELKQPAPDRLFAMSTAYVKMDMELESDQHGQGGDRLPAARHRRLRRASCATWRRSCAARAPRTTGTTSRAPTTSYGYRWMVLSDPDFEDLVVGVNAVSTAIQGGGYGDRILAAVFAFRDDKGKPLYWIYNYKRGAFYPFVPSGGAQQRDNERELRLKAQIGADLPVEPELERWFPLWGIPV